MPFVQLLIASGTAQRRLLSDTLERLASRGYRQVVRREGGDWSELLTENMGGGLFDEPGEKSVVVVEGAEKLGTLPPRLAPLLEGEGAPVAIILICKSETACPVPKTLRAGCALLTPPKEPPPWSKERDNAVIAAVRRHKLNIKPPAIALLKELCDDFAELSAEADKLGFFCRLSGRKEVTAEDVRNLCLSDGSRALLGLLDGFCAGRRELALESFTALRTHGELLPTLSAVHNRARYALYQALYPSDERTFAKALGVKDYAWRKAQEAARNHGPEKLLAFVMTLIRINAGEKSGIGGSWREFEIALIDLLTPRSGDLR